MNFRYISLATCLLAYFLSSAPLTSAQENETAVRSRSAGSRTAEDLIGIWKKMDKDGDGKVTQEEAEGQLKTNFTRNDLNEDGFLDQVELEELARRLTDTGSQASGRGGDGTQPLGDPPPPNPPGEPPDEPLERHDVHRDRRGP